MPDNTYGVDQSLWGRMSPSDMMTFNQTMAGAGGGRDQLAQQMAQQPQQALSGGTVQYSTPTAPTGVPAQADNSDIPASLLARMSPTDIMLFRQASQGKAIPTGVAGPYGGGAMGAPQIPSGYNAFSGAGLPPANIGGGLYGGGYGGADFFGGGGGGGGGGGSTPAQPSPLDEAAWPYGPFKGPSETFDSRFPDPGGGFNGGTSTQPYGGGGFYWPNMMNGGNYPGS
jgi:hypothetical protein